jgi:hypothetical protein
MLDAMMRQCVQPFSSLLYPHVHTPDVAADSKLASSSGVSTSATSPAATTTAVSSSSSSSSTSSVVVNPLDSHHGFIVEYELGKDSKLDFHVDEADVTLNLCLGKEFKGGDLYFAGIR